MTANSPLNLGRAWDLVDRLVTSIALACPDLQTLEPAGDLRRGEPVVNSIVLAGSARDVPAATAAIHALFPPNTIRERTDDRIITTYLLADVDIRITTPENFGTLLVVATGSGPHLQQLAERGFAGASFDTESALYSAIGLPFIAPELRSGDGEIEAAASGALPALLDLSHVRGDLHMHTTYSDGRDSVATMVEGGHALGYDYLALTDHSARAAAARTLPLDAIAKQRDEIEAVRASFPRLAILHGIEVDILPNGRLDFGDNVLQGFDIVLASLHDRAGQDSRRLTERTLAAIRHPLVNIVCHPANRLVGVTDGYALDFEAIYAAAAETGTALEIDGAPSHLDLDAPLARAASRAGAMLTIDSDCHRVGALGRQMRFGVGIARRAWLQPDNVLNTRPVAEVREFVNAKRRGGR